MVITYNRLAAGRGISVGMSVAEARSLCADANRHRTPCFLPHDPQADREALRRLAWSCDRFSPVVGLEEDSSPECLLFDLTGCAPLFGGEENLARELQRQMQQFGLRVRIAAAGTVGAAWALAHCHRDAQDILLAGAERMSRMLRKLPVTALRLPSAILGRLEEFQLRHIGQLLAIPRESLPSRFGKQLLQRVDQALGTLPEEIVPLRRPEPVEAVWETETPLQSQAALETVMTQLLESVLSRLQDRGEGVQQMTLGLSSPGHQTQKLTVECVRPTAEFTHLLDLLRLRWERQVFPDGLHRIHLSVLQAGRQTWSEGLLWQPDHVMHHERDLERLIERLSSRLGTESVLRPVLTEDVQPERSFRCDPAVTEGHRNAHRSPKGEDRVDGGSAPVLSRLTRPVWLLSVPEPVEAMSADAAGPPYRFRRANESYTIARHWGPERITTGWWRQQYLRRDYYQVEATGGERFWLFRELVSGRWFLHAACD